jgi:hypothetical protein
MAGISGSIGRRSRSGGARGRPVTQARTRTKPQEAVPSLEVVAQKPGVVSAIQDVG